MKRIFGVRWNDGEAEEDELNEQTRKVRRRF